MMSMIATESCPNSPWINSRFGGATNGTDFACEQAEPADHAV
jgi:hypothetical protein